MKWYQPLIGFLVVLAALALMGVSIAAAAGTDSATKDDTTSYTDGDHGDDHSDDDHGDDHDDG